LRPEKTCHYAGLGGAPLEIVERKMVGVKCPWYSGNPKISLEIRC